MAESLPSKKPGDQEETLEFLKREEVRTMAKDIALLREEEAKKERERIAKIQAGEPKKKTPTPAQAPKPQPILQAREEEKQKPPSLMPHAQAQKPVFLKARTRSEKIVIRIIVIGVLLFILVNGLAFGYWYFTRKKVMEIIPSPQPAPIEQEVESQPAGGDSTLAPIEVAEPPVVFFEPVQEKTIEVATTDNLPLLLSNALKEEDSKESSQGFTRVFVRETGDTAPIPTREFLDKAGVVMPEPLLSLLNEDFMLFVYSSPGRKRLGFIGELSQVEGVQDILRTWETTLEQDTKQLWDIVGQKGSAYTTFFRQAVHQNSLVRFQTFSVLDFGTVYTLFGAKLILTTSFESLTKAVDLLMQSRR